MIQLNSGCLFFFLLLLLLFQLSALQFSVFIKESNALWMPLRGIKSNYLILAGLIAVCVCSVINMILREIRSP